MARDYALYIESGPQHRKTMVHVLELLGCVAVGPTTEAAIEATPDAIRAYLRFLERIGEDVDPGATFTTHVEEHITEGSWLGNGDPNIVFTPDLTPVSEEELAMFAHRAVQLREALASWVESAGASKLDEMVPGSSRSSRAILLHVMGPTGAYVSPVLGTVRGVSALQRQAERGELPIAEALRRSMALVAERLETVTEEERARASSVRRRRARCARACGVRWSTTGSTWRSYRGARAGRRCEGWRACGHTGMRTEKQTSKHTDEQALGCTGGLDSSLRSE